LLLLLDQGLNAHSVNTIEQSSKKLVNNWFNWPRNLETLSKSTGRLESGLGFALINAIGVEGIALGPLLFAFGSSIYSTTSLGIESLEPVKNLFDSHSQKSISLEGFQLYQAEQLA